MKRPNIPLIVPLITYINTQQTSQSIKIETAVSEPQLLTKVITF